LKELKKSGQSKKQAEAKTKAQAKQKGGKPKQAEQNEIQVTDYSHSVIQFIQSLVT